MPPSGNYRIKPAKGRLPLVGNSPDQIFRDLDTLGAISIAIEDGDIVAAAKLPLFHGDPFDRMLIAQAQRHALTLATKDPEIARYDVTVLWQ
jgi:PIN domain nuclease of toxin-antitoxin system